MPLRYAWSILDLPSRSACGASFSIDHSQICMVGEFLHARLDQVRDLLATHMKEAFKAMEVEPTLTPLTGEILQPRTAITTEDAKADIRVNGFWMRQKSAFFDIRVFYPQALSYRDQSQNPLSAAFEAEKKRKYVNRIVLVERGSFTPWFSQPVEL